MSTYTKENLTSELVTIITNVDTKIYDSNINANVTEEVWVYGSNSGNQDALVTIYVNSANNIIFKGVLEAYSGNTLLIPGIPIKGNTNISLSATSSVADIVNIFGYVNRITES